MLSRKGSSAGMKGSTGCTKGSSPRTVGSSPVLGSGADRSRVGERLRAALAGLQELHLLRDRQGDMVSWALRMDREEPVSAGLPDPRGAEERRLEATLTTLKQQLSRLRKQDVGLKSHLQQLDQQISDLKLDASGASAEPPESDSRPSSGFYELSDGGSCSLSTSCTSVYSECLSSSQTSLLLSPAGAANAHVAPPAQGDVCRRRSADESSAQANPPRAGGLHLGSSRIRAGPEKARPRPVSTGDLDRMMAQGPSHHRPADAKRPSACSTLRTTAVDPKFHSNLVSRSGAEVYRYPSPLHAVALQSPIFSHGGDPASPGPLEGRGPLAGGGADSLQRAQAGHETKSLGYMDQLLLRSLSRVQSEAGPEALQRLPRRPAEGPQRDPGMAPRPLADVPPLQSQKRRSPALCGPEPAHQAEQRPAARAPDGAQRYSYPAATRDYNADEVTASSMRRNDRPPGEHARGERGPPEAQERKASRQRAAPQSAEAHATSPEFVHAHFVPAGSQRVKVRQADRKTKALKLRRKSVEKPRAARPPHGASGERPREAGGGTRGDPRRPGRGPTGQKPSGGQSEERPQGSGSDSGPCSLLGPHPAPPRPQPGPAGAKSSRSRRPPCAGYEPPPAEPRRRRPGAARWPSDGETFLAPRRAPAPGGVQLVRGPKWTGPPRCFQSANPFLHSLDARYPAAALGGAGLYPPRCESEYSAECASLFHSTIAESSEGDASDATANRFGDSESSQSSSDSEGGPSPDEERRAGRREGGGLVWAQAALGPAAAGQPPRPEPPACRIKASRALKKKIRRFQPASLKVMTLV
ncbi:Dapper 2 [Liparis tanakae]|uniref:Dapper 2 n=1 Tax=Liparis tanakae TaxID=230148 RepID=A0A4Z2G0K9_9TELE|nr:Dapper 2 [Liparis tanakae]